MNMATFGKKGILLWAATFTLAACSLIYELLIAQLISVFAGNTVVWYSLTIGLFLLGMGIGAVVVSPMLKRTSSAVGLFWTESVLCILGALAPFVLHFAALRVLWGSRTDEWVVNGSGFFLTAIGLALTIGLCTGIELPLLMQRAREVELGQKPVSSTQLLAADYFGSLAGALAFSLLLWPNFEPTQIGIGAAALNLLVAIVVVASPRPSTARRVRTVCLSLLTGMLVVLSLANDSFMSFFLRRYYAMTPGNASLSQMLWPEQQLPTVSRIRSAYQNIDFVRSVQHDRSFYLFDLFSEKLKARPNFPQRVLLFLNGEVQFFSDFEEVYHEFFAHVPIAAFNIVPRRILVLGGGDGLLLRELLKYSDVEAITLVDLDPSMLAFSSVNSKMRYINNSSFDDSRVRTVAGDAYHFVRTTRQTFDAVFMDFPEVTDYNLSRLYSSEFYHFVLQRLSKEGFAVINAGDIEYLTVPDENGVEQVTKRNRWAEVYQTFKAAGFEMIEPFYSRLEHEFPEAVQRVSELNLAGLSVDDSEQARESAAKLFLRYNTASLRSGFIMLSKVKRQLANRFSSKAQPLFVLNDSRYRSALKSPLKTPPLVGANSPNSVFQPNWTGKPLWSIRRPLIEYDGIFSNTN